MKRARGGAPWLRSELHEAAKDYIAKRADVPRAKAMLDEALALVEAAGGRVHAPPTSKGNAVEFRVWQPDEVRGLETKNLSMGGASADDGIEGFPIAPEIGDRVRTLWLDSQDLQNAADAARRRLWGLCEGRLDEVAAFFAAEPT